MRPAGQKLLDPRVVPLRKALSPTASTSSTRMMGSSRRDATANAMRTFMPLDRCLYWASIEAADLGELEDLVEALVDLVLLVSAVQPGRQVDVVAHRVDRWRISPVISRAGATPP